LYSPAPHEHSPTQDETESAFATSESDDYTTTMKESLPIRETRRMFLIVLFARAIIFAMGFYMVAFRFGPFIDGPLIDIGIALPRLVPTLLMAILVLLPSTDSRRRKRYLAGALSLDIVVMSIQMVPTLFLRRVLGFSQPAEILEATRVDPFLFLLISLVLLAWAYGRRGAVWGSSLALLFHLISSLVSLWLGFIEPEALPRNVLQIALLGVVPFLVSTLAQRERQQMTELEAAHARLQRHTTTVEQLAISRERNRLARSLHDTLAHSLAALTVHLEALRTLQTHDPAAVQEAINEAISVARQGLEESRQAIQALRIDPLATLGLVGALRGALQALKARTGLETALSVAGQESDQRHAEAQSVSVRLAFGKDRTELTIRDDGKGFDPASVNAAHYGLTGMQERAAMIGATLEASSHPGSGTVIWCSLER